MNKTRPCRTQGQLGQHTLNFIVAFQDLSGSVRLNNLGRYWRDIEVLTYKGFEHSV